MKTIRQALVSLSQRLKHFPAWVWVREHRRSLGVVVLIAFAVFLVIYIANRPSIIEEVLAIGWANLIVLFVLYLGVLGTHFGILHATIRLCGKSLPAGEEASLTVYSTVVNFFGPLQSGPGFRAVYLRARIGLRVREYAYASVFYYLVFAVINCSLIFCRAAPWVTVVGLVVGCLAIALVARTRFKRSAPALALIAAITAVQILLMSTVYFVEINAVGTDDESFVQALSYSASANLSLFVSVTPGAIGIREAFLVFASTLHQVPLSSIVSAGIIDRAFYVVFLGVLFAISSAFHLKGALFKRQAEGGGDPLP